MSASPLSDMQKAYLAILEEARIGSKVAGYRSGLVRALVILEGIDPDAEGGAYLTEPGVSYGPEVAEPGSEGGAR